MTSELHAAVQAWIADETDPADAAELRTLLTIAEDPAAAPGASAQAEADLAERFARPLAFGTAGLRGPLRAGPNGMNRTVVRRAAAGLAAFLTATGQSGRPVVIGFDARRGSANFAADSAAVLAAAGFDARLLPRVLPTPLVAYAVRHLEAAAGVMVTASHNPPADNGYKVFAADGAQIVPPTDTAIEAEIAAVGPARAIPLAGDRVTVLDDEVVEAYVHAVAGLVPTEPRALRIVHTALHGVGTEVIGKVFATAGFAPLLKVAEQAAPDAAFPTVAFPNPEEPGALDLALALAAESDADLVLANDPDADRCAAAIPGPDGWRALRGDELGVLLADRLLTREVRGTYATTIVSSSLLRAMTAAAGAGYVETLTGFKWLARAADDLVFAYEEALGYAVAPHLVRDKDGISAALVLADYAAELLAAGSSLGDRLADLAARFGRHATDQLAVRVDDLDQIAVMMTTVRTSPPPTLLDVPVTVEDLRPDADAIRWRVPGGRVVIRASGTEPKLKAYLEVITDGTATEAAAALARLRAEVAAALGV